MTTLNRFSECPACKGNDADMPCAYPGDQLPGCLRVARLHQQAMTTPTPATFKQGWKQAMEDEAYGSRDDE